MNSKNGDTIQALPPGPRPLPLLSVPLYVRKGFSQYFNVKSRPGFWKHRIDSQEGYQGGEGGGERDLRLGQARKASLSHTHTHTLPVVSSSTAPLALFLRDAIFERRAASLRRCGGSRAIAPSPRSLLSFVLLCFQRYLLPRLVLLLFYRAPNSSASSILEATVKSI